jgi:hypothetical protein
MNEKCTSDEVTDRKSFIKFVNSFRNEFDNNNWENNTLESFLEALEAYADDIQGFYANCEQKINADTPSWRTFAKILEAAANYE